MGLRRNNNLMLPILTSLLTLNIFKCVKRQRCAAIDSIFNIANDVPQRFCVLMNHGKALVLMFYRNSVQVAHVCVDFEVVNKAQRWSFWCRAEHCCQIQMVKSGFLLSKHFFMVFSGVKLTRRPTHIDTLLYTFHFRVLTLQVILL